MSDDNSYCSVHATWHEALIHLLLNDRGQEMSAVSFVSTYPTG
jgi:hypothetical protein